MADELGWCTILFQTEDGVIHWREVVHGSPTMEGRIPGDFIRMTPTCHNDGYIRVSTVLLLPPSTAPTCLRCIARGSRRPYERTP